MSDSHASSLVLHGVLRGVLYAAMLSGVFRVESKSVNTYHPGFEIFGHTEYGLRSTYVPTEYILTYHLCMYPIRWHFGYNMQAAHRIRDRMHVGCRCHRSLGTQRVLYSRIIAGRYFSTCNFKLARRA